MNNKNNNLVALSLVIIVISYFVAFMLLSPTLAKNRKQVGQLQSDVKLAQEKLDSLNTAEQKITDVKGVIEKVAIAVPEKSDFQSILVSLEAIGAKNGVGISNFQPNSDITTSSTESGVFPKVSFSFSMSGDYAKVLGVVKDLETNLRIIKIDSVVLSGLDTTNLQASVSGSAYSRQAGATGGQGE